jgi:hypothetical protein
VPAPAPTLASAVPSGDGDVCLSLPSFSADKDDAEFKVGNVRLDGEGLSGWVGGAGDTDFWITTGTMAGGVNKGAAPNGGWSKIGAADLDDEGIDADDADTLSNLTGRTRGVVCTAVISLALSQ